MCNMIRYRGKTESERIECALKVRDIEQAVEFLGNARVLTQGIFDTLQECRAIFVEAEEPNGVPAGAGGEEDLMEPDAKQVTKPKQRIRQVE
ncbi:MAG: hypothetical protein PHH09_11555 [Methanoregulaceae archaeon]|nr:hypothetical protein [Methanoregulaceae archaeon]